MQGRRLPDLSHLSSIFTRAPSGVPTRTRYVTPQNGWGTDAQGHTLFRTKDGGRSWVVVRRFPKETINDFQFFEEGIGFALLSGSLYKTTDGGRRWLRVFAAPEEKPVERMLFSNARAGYFLDHEGLAWHTKDGGRTWLSDRGERVSERRPQLLAEAEPAPSKSATAETASPPAAPSAEVSAPAPSAATAEPAPTPASAELPAATTPRPPSPSADARQRFERATALYERGDYEGTLAMLEPIERPTAAVATLRGWAYYRRDEIGNAKQAFLQALALDPDAVQAQNGKAYCFYREYRYAEAEKIFRDVLARAPQNVDALIGAGLIAYYNGRYPEAQQIFERVTHLAPQNKEVQDYLERARQRRGPG